MTVHPFVIFTSSLHIDMLTAENLSGGNLKICRLLVKDRKTFNDLEKATIWDHRVSHYFNPL